MFLISLYRSQKKGKAFTAIKIMILNQGIIHPTDINSHSSKDEEREEQQ